MRILLYCIFTNDYNKLLPNWLKYTATRCYPGLTDVLILTDDKECSSELPNVMVRHIKPYSSREELLFAKFNIHLQVVEEFSADYDLFVHFQSNCLLARPLLEDTLDIRMDKLNCFTHLTYPYCKAILANSVAQKGSAAYRPISSYGDIYLQSAMLIGSGSALKEACHYCIAMCEEDIAANQLDKAPYQDECYLNTYAIDHPEKVNIIKGEVGFGPAHCVDCSDELIYLTDKHEAGIVIINGRRIR